MKPNITVQEVLDKEKELNLNIKKLLMDFRDETGFYIESVHPSYWDSLSQKRTVLQVELISRINT